MYSSSKFSSMMFSSMMVVVMLQMLLLQTAAEVSLSINPARIDVGVSPSLDVNCTFSIDTSSAMAEIISLTVSRENSTELVSITDYSDHKVNLMSSEGITADGVINPGGQSYIHLHWDYPTDTQKGTYQCSAQGMDLFGHILVVSDTAMVIQDQVDLMDLMDKIVEMDRHIQELDQRLFVNDGYTKELEDKLVLCENYTKDLEERLSQKNDYIKDLEQNISDSSALGPTLQTTVSHYAFSFDYEEPFLTYGQKSYFVSKDPYTDIHVAINDCKDYGGQLVELNDYSEYHAIRDYLKTLSDVDRVYIAGDDENYDHIWTLPSSSEEIHVADWGSPNGPGFDVMDQCTCLYNGYDWRMESNLCHYREDQENVKDRYMCEI